jgi:hypothetical protein
MRKMTSTTHPRTRSMDTSVVEKGVGAFQRV